MGGFACLHFGIHYGQRARSLLIAGCGYGAVPATRQQFADEAELSAKRFEIFERIMPDSRGRAEYHYVLVDYLCRVGRGRMRAGDDVSRVEWAPRRAVRDYLLTAGTGEVIERAFKTRNARRKRTRI